MDMSTDKRVVGIVCSNASFAADVPCDFSKDSKDLIKSASSLLSFSNEPLNDFSELLATLSIKKSGLSRYYKGKSRTFTSLSDVKCIEDLAKRDAPHLEREVITHRSPKAII